MLSKMSQITIKKKVRAIELHNEKEIQSAGSRQL